MDDVIFAGTPNKPALGRAQIELTIDNSDGALPIEFTEVTISRTLFRNGGSEYAINGEACRLLDIQELLSDSGIGREMHVIVGQGQLDSILQATPEERRGFIEEAAGVLKHRKRKEKALRKLEATQSNLVRLQDLAGELRRQLKPLGRQAQVAKRAQSIQATVRDARLRLLADDLVAMRQELERELADETKLRESQRVVREKLQVAKSQERDLEAALGEDLPRLNKAQEVRYQLQGLQERFNGTRSLAQERVRVKEDDAAANALGPDPAELERQATEVRARAHHISQELAAAKGQLDASQAKREAAEREFAAEDTRLTAALQAAADRREGLARLAGEVAAARSRVETRLAEVERLNDQVVQAEARASKALTDFQALETEIASMGDSENGLDEAHEFATSKLAEIELVVNELSREIEELARERAGLAARADALTHAAAEPNNGGDALLASGYQGVRDSLARSLEVEPEWQSAIAVALGPIADAVTVDDLSAALAAAEHLKQSQAGRAAMVLTGVPRLSENHLPNELRPAMSVIRAPESVRDVIGAALATTVLVSDLAEANNVVSTYPHLKAVTRAGDLVSSLLVVAGSSRAPTRMELLSAIEEAERSRDEVARRLDQRRFEVQSKQSELAEAKVLVQESLDRLHESDAAMAAVAERLGDFAGQSRSAQAEADRLGDAKKAATEQLSADQVVLAELQGRHQMSAAASETQDVSATKRDDLLRALDVARVAETDARLRVRTSEERESAALARAEELSRAAETEREARAIAQAMRDKRRQQARVAAAVLLGVDAALAKLAQSIQLAEESQREAERIRAAHEGELLGLRAQLRELGGQLERLVSDVHRDEVTRTEQRLRIEQVELRAVEEFGIDAESLVSEYGPDQLVPPVIPDDAYPEAPVPPSMPYDREQQEKRAKNAERELALLGKINPLALEEFAALEERNQFLTEQIEDVKRTRKDLYEVIKEVDDRIQQVFADAFRDTAEKFVEVFAKLFPGGEGKLVLTDPSDLLVSGIDIEARPAGKRIKRLSLLSGGERSLTTIAFLLALFKALPSPFYVLDEVEATLDDVNLGRLLTMYEDLRQESQLIIVTHQKRTMEVADALYGISMSNDGISKVVSQRLREVQSA
jgi:chromosome segregation protein